MSKMTDLLPCPFCGGTAVLKAQAVSGYEYAACSKCGIEGPPKAARVAVVRAWNSREKAPSASVEKCADCPYDSGCVNCIQDIVNRLRKGTGDGLRAFDMMNEAADEIDRLRGKVDELAWAVRTALNLPMMSDQTREALLQKVLSK